LILEGIVTTLGEAGVNIAPMGPRLDAPYTLGPGVRFELRPFQTSQTFANLCARPEGVLHVTDDVLLLARAAVGPVVPPPAMTEARHVGGRVLADACRAYEFRLVGGDTQQPRAALTAEVVGVHRLRDFFGFNRAMHAVLEAAILATRTALLPAGHVEAEYARLAVLVAKTGGPREQEAFAFLQGFVASAKDVK
jgi:hypothetical protein